MNPVERLLDCQQGYFEIVASSKLLAECELLDPERVRVPQRLVEDSGQPLVRTRKGWQPSVMGDVEQLLDRVHEFWQKRATDVAWSLSRLEGRYIHVGDGFLDRSIPKYSVFFSGLLVSDQLSMIRLDYLNNTHFFDWHAIALNVVKTAIKYRQLTALFTKQGSNAFAFVVPPSVALRHTVSDDVTDAAQRAATTFVSQLAGREFADIPEFVQFCQRTKPTDADFDPDLLRIVYSRNNAADASVYLRETAAFHFQELGQDVSGLPPAAQLSIDIAQRLWEIERFARDAYGWAQEAEIPWYDVPLFDWWMRWSSGEFIRTLGSTYSADFVAKAAVLSPSLGFLASVPTDELIAFRNSDTVEALREDLSMHRLHLRHSKDNLQTVVSSVGSHIQHKLDEFEAALGTERNRIKSSVTSEAAKFGASGALTIASGAFPPLSAASLLWGSSLADLIKVRSTNKKRLEQLLARPVASLVEWRRRTTPPRTVAPAV